MNSTVQYMLARHLISGLLAFTIAPVLTCEANEIDLRLLGSIKIANPSVGFHEPSGLALNLESGALISVSDDTRGIFMIERNGFLDEDGSLRSGEKDVEGITWVTSSNLLLAVKEDTSEILMIDPEAGQIIKRVSLFALPGFETLQSDFPRDTDGKGLEGITENTSTGNIFVIKEGRPRLLIELARDLSAVISHDSLNADAGFAVEGVEDRDLDVSGVVYDGYQDRFWIVSDFGSQLFLYDHSSKSAVSAPLFFRKGSKLKLVENAEGIALNAEANILFIITDDEDESILVSYEIMVPK